MLSESLKYPGLIQTYSMSVLCMGDSFSTQTETRKEGASFFSFPWPEHEGVFVHQQVCMGHNSISLGHN